MAATTARAYFALVGYHFNPADITRLLGLEPTTFDDAGARSGLDSPVISSWELSTATVDSDQDEVDVYKLTDEVLKQLEPVKDKIVEVCKSHNLSPRVGVVLRLSTDDGASPEVGFGARMIRFLADIGAFIDVDYQVAGRS